MFVSYLIYDLVRETKKWRSAQTAARNSFTTRAGDTGTARMRTARTSPFTIIAGDGSSASPKPGYLRGDLFAVCRGVKDEPDWRTRCSHHHHSLYLHYQKKGNQKMNRRRTRWYLKQAYLGNIGGPLSSIIRGLMHWIRPRKRRWKPCLNSPDSHYLRGCLHGWRQLYLLLESTKNGFASALRGCAFFFGSSGGNPNIYIL